jgi:predicted ATPase
VQGERIGPYRIEARLGAGGMGEVYKAYDERLERWVALKRISPQLSRDAAAQRERLLREARASARLSHPAIVQVFDLMQVDGADCIVMELVEGTPLSSLLHGGPLAWPRAVALAREIAAALGAAHAQRIVHRDLKTENVMVTPDGHAKVFDFGISKRVDAAENEPALTREGVVIGTLRSMAPEQAQGKEVDHRADLFSLGVLLYEMVTGRSPFQAATTLATLHRLCYEPHTPLREVDPSLPASLSFLVDHLLDKQPERRPGSAGEVAASLAEISGEPQQLTAEASITVDMPRVSLADSTVRASSTAERRLVTVLSCGLVRAGGGSPDPEEMIEAMPLLQIAAVLAARRFEGRVVPDKSEGCRVYFGDLQAHEDDARRAVHTALEIVSRRDGWKDGFAAQIGIHTGPMVVTRAAAPESALGETPGIAAFLKNLAGAGAVVISESTFRLVEGWFECEALGAVAMPAAQQPLQLYRVVAEREARSRLQGTGALTPLVAREQELSLLLARWDLAREGRGQVVLVSGEAGVGKSRLVWELRRRVQAGGGQWIEGHGSPFHHDSPLYPIAQWLEQWIAADRSDPPELRLERLREALSRHGLAPEVLPLLAAQLSLPAGEHPPLPPEAQRRQTLEALLALLLATAERQPLLLAVEDLHWVDPSTLELLETLAAEAEAVPLLLVLTFRPELELPWAQRSSVTRLGLGLLSRSQAGLMIDRLTADRRLDPALREQIVAHTDGVPLFVEEMTKMFLDARGSGELPRSSGEMLKVPGTLEGWLMARLDRLGTAKEVAQLAATIGREIPHELLAAVSPWSEEDLDRELDRLVHAELLFRRGLPPRVRYVFKHALLQDAAYTSLLKSDRKRHHQSIAEALEERFPETAAAQPELVAHHFTEAGRPEQAVPRWRRAGENAIQASAFLEAAGHLERALGLLAELPESAARDEQEIGLQLAFGIAKGAGLTPADPEVGEAYARALELCQRAGDPPQLFAVLRGLISHHTLRGHPRQALEMASQLLEMAERAGSLNRRMNAFESMSFTLLNLGDLVAARNYLEALIDLGRPQRELSRHRVLEPFLGGLAESAWILWALGYPGQAVERSREALEKVRQSASFTASFVKFFSADLHIFRHAAEEVLPLARELVALSAEYRLRAFSVIGDFQLGWVAAEQGDAVAGIETMRRALDARLASGAVAGSTVHFAFLAAHLLEAGRFDEGLATAERALALAAEGGHALMDAEHHRLKGEMLQGLGAAEGEVEDEFHRALDIARRQSAKSLELRAAMSLARRWHGLGRSAEARDLLAPIYGWFTEGFETRDLQEARSLLAELG